MLKPKMSFLAGPNSKFCIHFNLELMCRILSEGFILSSQ